MKAILIRWRRFSLRWWNVVWMLKMRYPKLFWVQFFQVGLLALPMIFLCRRLVDIPLYFSVVATGFSFGWCLHIAGRIYDSERALSVSLSAPDLAHISAFKTCPDCVCGQLRRGPRGGASMNVRCSNEACGHEFNIVFMSGAALTGERIDRDDSSLYAEEFV